jgi:hypothetical protein
VKRPSFALVALALAAHAAGIGCRDQGSPEAVADAFVDAYFVQVDQEKAKEFTALGATKMLEDELREVAQVRDKDHNPIEARGDVTVTRGEPVMRDQRIRFPYQIAVRADAAETTQQADIELTRIQGGWKVVRVGLSRGPQARP